MVTSRSGQFGGACKMHQEVEGVLEEDVAQPAPLRQQGSRHLVDAQTRVGFEPTLELEAGPATGHELAPRGRRGLQRHLVRQHFLLGTATTSTTSSTTARNNHGER